jgi:hypothetical protein
MADDLRTRESVMRKALWALLHLIPGDPKAAAILDVQSNIEDQELSTLTTVPGLYTDAARKAAEIIGPHSSGISIVHDAIIPKPSHRFEVSEPRRHQDHWNRPHQAGRGRDQSDRSQSGGG